MTDQPTQADTSADTHAFQPVPPEPAPGPAAPPVPSSSPPKRSTGISWVNLALALALAIAIGGVGFAAGRLTAPATLTAANGTGRFGNGNFPGGFGGGYFPGGFQGGDDNGGANGGGGFRGLFGAGGTSITGTVESISGDTLTLKLASGATIQISLSGTTTYHAQASASSGDVKAGGTVIVRVELNRGTGTTAISASASDVTVVP